MSTPVTDPTGEWTMTTAETSDPCNLSSEPDRVQDVQVTRNGDTYEVRVEGQPCSSALVLSASPSGIAYLAQSSPITSESINGCSYDLRTGLTISITQDTIQGTTSDTATHFDLPLPGYPPSNCTTPCILQRTIQGRRCDDCFDGGL
jgi:hypothetical protein